MSGGNGRAPGVRERELELALARIERMSRPLTNRGADGKVVGYGRVEVGSLAAAAQIAREALNG